MGKFKVGRGFLIASFVLACLGVFLAFICYAVIGATQSVIRDLVISNGGSTSFNGSALTYIVEHAAELETMDTANFELLDAASLEILYVTFVFVKELVLILLICNIAGFVLLLIALIQSKHASSKKALISPMVLSFVSILFVGLLPAVTGILFAVTKDDDFRVVE